MTIFTALYGQVQLWPIVRWENSRTQNHRDLYFRTSANQFLTEISITPEKDQKDIRQVVSFESASPAFRGNRLVPALAVEVASNRFSGDQVTEVYAYHPSTTPGKLGSFSLFKTVATQPGTRFRLQSANLKNLIGLIDSPGDRSLALVPCH